MNLREAIREARRLGATVEPKNGTGEIRFRHPATPRTVLANCRRKDTPRAVIAWLHHVKRGA